MGGLEIRHKIESMTTRAGTVGLLTGLIITIILYPLYGFSAGVWIAAVVAVMLMIGGGLYAARWSGSKQPIRCAVLGALAGGLAGMVVFCLWAAAVAVTAQAGSISAVVHSTMGMFLLLFLGGSGLGTLGGWLARINRSAQPDVFDKNAPQMAMNAAITAVPASILAAALVAGLFARLANIFGDPAIVGLPLAVGLLLVLISQLALMLVVPHETHQAEHLCGMDEVKMAAYVGIGAAPLLMLLLFLADNAAFANPLVIIALLASAGMSLKSLHTLFKVVLPRRAAFPPPKGEQRKTEARLFGTIADSRGPRLLVLCIGCGLAMVLPLYVSVVSVLINLTASGAIFPWLLPGSAWRLFAIQALVSTGSVTTAIILLSTIYIFYLNLGRWFSKWNVRRS